MSKMLCLLAFLLPLVSAHMVMVVPQALGLQQNKNTQPNDVDYSLSSPLSSVSDFPCKGKLKFLGTPSGASVATWAAGSSQSFQIHAGAPHGGGSCQASISEDNGATFRVMKSYEGGCPSSQTVATTSTDTVEPFTVPMNTKSGQAIFAWTWFNLEGNKEMYMNCAVVTITGGGSSAGLSNLPSTFVANIGNGCSTVANTILQFPDPGTDVSKQASGTLPVGNCGASGSGGSPAASGAPAAPATSATATAATGGSETATSVVVAPVASSATYSAGMGGGAYTSVTYNNGLYTGAGAAAATSSMSVPTIVPTVVSPAVSSPVSPPVNPIPSSVAADTSCASSIMPAAPGTAAAVYGTPAAAPSSTYTSPSSTYTSPAASETSVPNCKRSARYSRSEPKVIPRSPGCSCQCPFGGTPQLIGQCS